MIDAFDVYSTDGATIRGKAIGDMDWTTGKVTNMRPYRWYHAVYFWFEGIYRAIRKRILY